MLLVNKGSQGLERGRRNRPEVCEVCRESAHRPPGLQPTAKHFGTDKESVHKSLLILLPMTRALRRLQGLEMARGMGSQCCMGVEFQLGKMKILEMNSSNGCTQRCECTQCLRTAHLKMGKMANFRFCIFYHNKFKRPEQFQAR